MSDIREQEEYELYLEWRRQKEAEIDRQNEEYAHELEYRADWLQDQYLYADDDALADWIFEGAQS